MVLNQEGEIIENRLLGWGFGGWNCIGRAVLFGEGGMVACVLNREGGTVGDCRLCWGFGGWNCLGRVVLSVEGVVVARFSWSCLSG